MASADRVEQLEAENERLRILVGELQAKIADLEGRLGQTSKNSSKPPSSDPNSVRAEKKLTRAERRVKAREQLKAKTKANPAKPGKQPGAEGHNLDRVADPDLKVTHRPECCAGCGGGLGDAEVVSSERRQVFDLPPIVVKVTEHEAVRVRCGCGTVNQADFPPEATAPACWGPGVRALAVYLMHRQHIPIARCAELLSDVLGAPVSTGFLAGLGPEAADRLTGFMARVKAMLGLAPVVHADETTLRVSAESWWLHVVATDTLTFLGLHTNRGRDAIDDLGVLPGYHGVVVHDGLAAYDYLDSALHQQCGAHLLRHLAKAMEHPDTNLWARLMTGVLLDAVAAHHRAADNGKAKVPATTIARLRRRYRHAVSLAFRLLPPGPLPRRRNTGGWAPHQRDSWNLAVRFRDGQADVLRFLTDTRISPTNNDAERPLRPAKLHDKISGTFRSPAHAKAFATIRSYIQTAAKHDENLLGVLTQLFTTGAWLPPDPTPA